MADSVLLSGAGARIEFSIGAANHDSGPITLACVIKRAAASNWDTLIGDWEGNFRNRLALSDANQVFMSVGGTDDLVGNPTTSSVAWQLLAVTKAVGSSIPRYHIYDGATWTHDAGGTALGDGTAMTAFSVSESGGDAFAGNILIFGIADTEFSDGTIETLAGGYQDWQDAAFTEGVRCDAASGLTSWTAGSMAQTSATGVTLDTGDAPTWWDDTLGGEPPIENEPETLRVVRSNVRFR